MYSLSRCSIASQEARIANGIRKVVSRTNGIEKPSTPSLKRIVSASQAWLSTSWKAGLAGSNRPQAQSDKRNVATVVNSAAQRAFERTDSSSPRSVRMKAAPTSGRISRPERMPRPSISALPRVRRPSGSR